MSKDNKVPPHNIEAEQSVLGGILLDNSAYDVVAQQILPEDFYKKTHNMIFNAMIELAEKREPVDVITLTEELNRSGLIEEIGGSSYLACLLDMVPSTANISYYTKIVKDKSTLRKMIKTATTIISDSYTSEESVDDILNKAEMSVFEIAERDIGKKFVPIKNIIKNNLDKIEKLYETKKAITGVSSGYTDLDRITSGFQPSDLIIIASRPSVGKTALSLNIASNAALYSKVPVAIFSLEMQIEQIGNRILSAEARINSMSLRTGFLKAEDWPKLARAAGVLGDTKIFIDDTFGVSIPELRSKLRRLKREEDIQLVIVDYLQLVRSGVKLQSREQEIAYISRSLKGIAKELSLPIIALSQLSREPEKRESKRPQMSDLRESGAIEQDADIIAFIYRSEMYTKEAEDEGVAELIIAKHRNGPTGEVHLAFLKNYARFENIEE